jgi:hypothetical protein
MYRFSYFDAQTGPQLKSHFILILPALTSVALSSGGAKFEALCNLMAKIVSGVSMRPSPWVDESLPGRDMGLLITREVLHQFALVGQETCERNLDLSLQVIVSLLDVILWSANMESSQVIEVGFLLLRLHMKASSGPLTGSDEDRTRHLGCIEQCLGRLMTPFVAERYRYGTFSPLVSLVPSKHLLALPTHVCENWLPHFTVEVIDILFHHFLKIDSRKANPDFPATEADRLYTLAHIVKIVSDKFNMSEGDLEGEPICRWSSLLTSWHAMLINGDIGTGYNAETSAEGPGNEDRNEDSISLSMSSFSIRDEGTPDQSDEEANPVDTIHGVPDLISFIDRTLCRVEAGGWSILGSHSGRSSRASDRASTLGGGDEIVNESNCNTAMGT